MESSNSNIVSTSEPHDKVPDTSQTEKQKFSISLLKVDLEKLLKYITCSICNGIFRTDRKSTRLNSSHSDRSRMPSSA